MAERYGIEHNAPKHLAEVEARVHARVDATRAAVAKRLETEIRSWNTQALRLKDQELAGKRNAKLNSAPARQRADEAAERLERLAIDAVLATETALGRTPREMARNNKGYDIESRHGDGELLFVEVKGRATGADDFNVTASEILCARNNAERHILALVEVAGDDSITVRYLYDPFTSRAEPGFAENLRNLDWHEFWALTTPPC